MAGRREKTDWIYSIVHMIRLLRSGQIKAFSSAFFRKLRESNLTEEQKYTAWIKKNETGEDQDLHVNEFLKCKLKPLFTLITLPPIDHAALTATAESLRNQINPNWELLIVADEFQSESIERSNKIFFVQQDQVMEKINGDWIGYIACGDCLSPAALSEATIVINKIAEAHLIYSDEDLFDSKGVRSQPLFKPDWSPEFFKSSNYIGNFCIFRRDLAEKYSLLDRSDFLNSIAAKSNSLKAAHIPKVLYHCIKRPAISSIKPPELEIKRNARVSIIIPTKDRIDYLKRSIDSILMKSTYSDYEIVIIDHESKEPETLRCFDDLRKHRSIKIIKYSGTFNFSALNNFAASLVENEILLFLNNDTEVITPDWIEQMLVFAIREEIGAVGAKLLYPDGTIQHGGIAVGLPQIAVHMHRGFPGNSHGYMNRLISVHNVSAVTGACMMIRRNVFLEMGGFDEPLPYAYNDVDLCLRLTLKGYRIVWTPYSELYHYESSSRGYETTIRKQERLEKESATFLKRWNDQLQNGDPYYSPNLSLTGGSFSIRI